MLAFDRAPPPPHRGHVAFDRASDRRVDEDGHLHVMNVPISKAMVCPYFGKEIPGWKELGLVRDQTYMLLRPPEELEAAAASFDNKPLLSDHLEVTADNPEKLSQAGVVGRGVFFDGEYLRTPQLTVWDQADIDGIESLEKAELSASYGYEPVMEPGVFNGLHYDGRMTKLSANHVALVDRGRAGRDVKVNDALPKGLTMKKSVFDRFTRKAARLFANDADISTGEVEELLRTVAMDGAKDDDLNEDEDRDGKADDEEQDEDGKKKAEDAESDEDGKADDEEQDEDEGKKANDRARRPVAMDAAAIRKGVIGEISAWNTACEKVAPHIGRVRVAMDALPGGAAALYRKALDTAKVSHAGVTQLAALSAMVDMLPDPEATRRNFANDRDDAGASPLDGIVPTTRISRS